MTVDIVDPPPASDGREVIQQLLSQLDIERVFVVDDDVNTAKDESLRDLVVGSAQAIFDSLSSLAGEHEQFAPLLQDGDLPSDPDDLREALRELWPLLDEPGRRHLVSILPNDESDPDGLKISVAALDRVEELLPPGVEFHARTVERWKDEFDSVFYADSPATLVFFDRDLGASGGLHGGDVLVKELHDQTLTNVYCGLFTREVKSAEEEVQLADKLHGELGLFVAVMGKHRADESVAFAEGLRVFLYSSDLASIKDHTQGALAAAAKDAANYLKSIGYYAMMASAESAHHEGVFEYDGVLRMVHAHQRRQLGVHLHTGSPTASLERVRQAAANKLSSIFPKATNADQLEWAEHFDDGLYLATCAAPLEIGDIFEVISVQNERSYYVLIAQPCDLMVRSNGKRTPEIGEFVLSKLQPLNVDQLDRLETEEDAGRLIKIGKFVPESNQVWGVVLSNTLRVGSHYLDACVLDDQGAARISPQGATRAGLTEGWNLRSVAIEQWRAKQVAKAAALLELLPTKGFPARNKVIKMLFAGVMGPDFSSRISGSVDVESGVVEASIKRHSRLIGGHARAVLQLSGQYQTRPDTPADLYGSGDPGESNPASGTGT